VRPLVPVEFYMEFRHLINFRHVDESIPHVSLTVFVNWHVKEVLTTEEILINLIQQNSLAQPVRDVTHH